MDALSRISSLFFPFPVGSRDDFSGHKQGGELLAAGANILLSPGTVTAMDLSGKGCGQVGKGYGQVIKGHG